jgi:hypothetical protein
MNTSSRLNRSCCSIVIAISILITLLNFATNLFVIVGRKVFSAESAPRSLCFNNKMFNDTFFRTMDALFGRKPAPSLSCSSKFSGLKMDPTVIVFRHRTERIVYFFSKMCTVRPTIEWTKPSQERYYYLKVFRRYASPTASINTDVCMSWLC